MPIDPREDFQRLAPWLPDIRQAAAEEAIRPALLAGVCLRETGASWGSGYSPRGTHLGFGDGGYGWGLFQADLRTWEPALRGLIPGVDLLTPLGQARLAARHLASSRRLLGSMFPGLPLTKIEAAMLAAYNARIGRVAAQLSVGASVDAVTTPGSTGKPDYSADVLARAARLERQHPDLFPPPGG